MKNTNPKSFVFVLMPFNPEFNNIYELQESNPPAKKQVLSASVLTNKFMKKILWKGFITRLPRQILSLLK